MASLSRSLSLTSTRYEPVLGILNEVLLDCQNPTTLEAAHRLLRTITSNPRLLGRANTEQLLGKVLSDIGFGGLWRGSTFSTSSDSLKQRIVLADKLIEVRQYLYINALAGC